MKKIILLIILVFLISGCGKQTSQESNLSSKSMPNLSNKKALLIIAFNDYQDQEYNLTKETLMGVGIQITTASSQSGTAQGALGGSATVDLTLDQVTVTDFDAVIFIGGPGAVEYQNNSVAHQIAKDAVAQNKILAAICIAPTILAKAGVLQNKSATVWTSIADKSAADILKQNGANYLNQNVVVDGKIITANGPSASQQFGQKIIEVLEK